MTGKVAAELRDDHCTASVPVLVYTGLYIRLESQVDRFGDSDSESQTVSLKYSVRNLSACSMCMAPVDYAVRAGRLGARACAVSGSRVITSHTNWQQQGKRSATSPSDKPSALNRQPRCEIGPAYLSSYL